MTSIDLELRRVFSAYPTGVAVLAALVHGQPAGMAASSFVPVSLDPPLVSVCVAHTSMTWPTLRRLPRIGISVLAADQEDVARRLGARIPERFEQVPWHAKPHGCVVIDGAAAWFDCSVEEQVRAGDHDIVVLRIHDLDAAVDVSPLVFHRSTYRRIV